MKHKNIESYNALLDWLKSRCGKLPEAEKNIILDYEIASFNAFSLHLPRSNINGCAFHLGQIVWRRVQALKFSADVIKNFSVKLQVKMILALAFVPACDVVAQARNLMHYLLEKNHKLVIALYEWFESEYISGTIQNKSINFWNLHERTLKNIPRTTNSLEGFHRHLNTLITSKQTSFHTILIELKNEQTVTNNKILMTLYHEKNKKVDYMQDIISKYKDFEGIEFLRYIAYKFNWKLD